MTPGTYWNNGRTIHVTGTSNLRFGDVDVPFVHFSDDAGKHTIQLSEMGDGWEHRPEPAKRVKPPPPECGKQVECGGSCCRTPGHGGPCLCCGDEDGVPGTCPA